MSFVKKGYGQFKRFFYLAKLFTVSKLLCFQFMYEKVLAVLHREDVCVWEGGGRGGEP